jgi:hypothetical protein
METDILISVVNGYKDVSFIEVEEAFREAKVESEVVFRPKEGPFAFLEWLIPAGAMIIYSSKFLGKLGEKHAERLDDALANGFRKLWGKAFGSKAEIDYKIIDSKGRIKGEPFSAALKTSAKLRDGREILMLYRTDLSQEDFVRANKAFLDEIQAHLSVNSGDRLSEALARIPSERVPPPYTAVVYFNPTKGGLEIVDYVGSSMQERLVSYPITEGKKKPSKKKAAKTNENTRKNRKR